MLEQRLYSADEEPPAMMEKLSISLPNTVAIPEIYIHRIPYSTHGPPAEDWAHEMCWDSRTEFSIQVNSN